MPLPSLASRRGIVWDASRRRSRRKRLDLVPWSRVYVAHDGFYVREDRMSLTIGQVAKAADVNTETIRYYEREGLLPDPPRTPAGYRQYTDDAIRRVRFMKRAQALGFTLAEIGTLLNLRVRRGAACRDVVTEANGAVQRIEGKIRELQRMRAALGALTDACRERRALPGCPILDALEGEE